MTIAMSNTITLIAIPIALTTMNIDWQSALALSAPALATGKRTVMTINLKRQAIKA